MHPAIRGVLIRAAHLELVNNAKCVRLVPINHRPAVMLSNNFWDCKQAL